MFNMSNESIIEVDEHVWGDGRGCPNRDGYCSASGDKGNCVNGHYRKCYSYFYRTRERLYHRIREEMKKFTIVRSKNIFY